MKQPRLVVVGNGMAGIRTLEELLKLAPGMYDITVFGAEPYPNYNRILLSPVLAGEQDFDDIVLNPLSWYADNGITLHLGKQVTRIDRARRRVLAADGTEAAYDRLLLATGSLPFILPIPGKDLKGVIGYRDIDDTRTMIEAAKVKRRAVVIGGGLLGLEAANGLMHITRQRLHIDLTTASERGRPAGITPPGTAPRQNPHPGVPALLRSPREPGHREWRRHP